MTPYPKLSDLTRTKTVATVGPASSETEVLCKLIRAGVDVFRINMAHGSRDDHQTAIDRIRQASQQTGMHAGILVDLAGPKIRLGELHTDPVYFEPGSTVEFVRGRSPQNSRELTCNYENLLDEVKSGDDLMLCDGLVRLVAKSNDGQRLACTVVDGGEVRSRRGVNLPGVQLKVSALGEVDIDNAKWAASNDVDFISLSFVRTANEIEQLKSLIRESGGDAFVIAKIEKREALDELESIIRATDGVMVARGDLGVEIRIEKTPIAQKQIIESCQQFGKPVIVATQMLESMHHNRQPTRAEVSDVANAILDGADACMLSGETAVGDHPEVVVQTMQRIMQETEKELEHHPERTLATKTFEQPSISDAVVYGAARIARRASAKMVVIATPSGEAALVKSKQRDFIPTVAITDRIEAARRMKLFWGIMPVFAPPLKDETSITQFINEWAKSGDSLSSGDLVIMVVDTDLWPGVHESVVVNRVK